MDLIRSLKTLAGNAVHALIREQQVVLYRTGFGFLEQKFPGQIGPLRPDFEVWLTALCTGGQPPEGNKFQQLIAKFPQMKGILTGPAFAEISKDALAHFIQGIEQRAGAVPVAPPPIPVMPPPLPVAEHEVNSQK